MKHLELWVSIISYLGRDSPQHAERSRDEKKELTYVSGVADQLWHQSGTHLSFWLLPWATSHPGLRDLNHQPLCYAYRNVDTLRALPLCSLRSVALDGKTFHKYQGVAQTVMEETWRPLRPYRACGLRRPGNWAQLRPLTYTCLSRGRGSPHSTVIQFRQRVSRERAFRNQAFQESQLRAAWPFPSQLSRSLWAEGGERTHKSRSITFTTFCRADTSPKGQIQEERVETPRLGEKALCHTA